MSKVCPQRIIKEAIKLLEGYHETCGDPGSPEVDELKERLDNNIQELDSLEKALHRDGIIMIEEI